MCSRLLKKRRGLPLRNHRWSRFISLGLTLDKKSNTVNLLLAALGKSGINGNKQKLYRRPRGALRWCAAPARSLLNSNHLRFFTAAPQRFFVPGVGTPKKKKPRDELPRGPLSPHPSGLYFDTHMRMAAQRSPESRPLDWWDFTPVRSESRSDYLIP